VSEVTLHVGGRPYTVSCADGEEEHVRHLAAIVDGKLTAMGDNLAPGDAKNLLFAALILADEVDESRARGSPSPAPLLDESVARGLEALAVRLEDIAQKLESGAASA
jgi:cell division protein ZapA